MFKTKIGKRVNKGVRHRQQLPQKVMQYIWSILAQAKPTAKIRIVKDPSLVEDTVP